MLSQKCERLAEFMSLLAEAEVMPKRTSLQHVAKLAKEAWRDAVALEQTIVPPRARKTKRIGNVVQLQIHKSNVL